MRLKDIPHATPEEMLGNLLDVLTSLKNGHLTARTTEGFPGVYGQIAQVLNQHLEQMESFRREHARLMEELGVTGRLGGQMLVPGLSGVWQEMLADVNRTGANLTSQFRDGANVVRDLLHDDLSARMTARNIQGEFSVFRQHLNQLADEYQRRAPEPAAG